MKHCAGLDVPMKETAICVVAERRKVVKEGKVGSEPETIAAQLSAPGLRFELVGLEDLRSGLGRALREGLPLRRADWAGYLRWAVDCFRIGASGVADTTQIHTHMCYSEFNDIMPAVADMDADVISIETSRSNMELLAAFGDFAYPNAIGPGVWDIHSPRVPGVEEITALLRKAAEVIPVDRLWVNPDCGLKTRGWSEVEPAVRNMVAAARIQRTAANARAASLAR